MSTNMKVPFMDLVAPHLELEEELVQIFRAALRSAGFIGGPNVDRLEKDFAQFCGTQHCAGVGSGTDALRFALTAAGVQAGDIVLTVPFTFIATTEAVSQALALPDFIDVDPQNYTMDPAKLREYCESKCFFDSETRRLLHRKTRRPVTAVIPVHLYGQMADMDAIGDIAKTYNLTVIEDACQAHGAEYFSKQHNAWRRAGTIGVAAAFSFYPGKNLGACGEAGAVTTNDAALVQTVRMLRDHGQSEKYYHEIEGYNGRLDAIQAGILAAKLRTLASGNAKRRDLARNYDRLLAPVADRITLPEEPSWTRGVYHLYVVRSADRDRLRETLSAAGISTGIHYPIPLHLQNAYRNLGYGPGSFPVSEQVAAEVVSLPMYPQLRPEQQEYVAQKLIEFAGASRKNAPRELVTKGR